MKRLSGCLNRSAEASSESVVAGVRRAHWHILRQPLQEYTRTVHQSPR